MKKVGIYNPYMHILGGGERYVLTIAQCLSKDYHVDLFWNDPKILAAATEKFHLNVSNISVKRWFTNAVTRATQLRGYDTLFYVTDGSLFFTTASKNFLIIQSPDKIPHHSSFLIRAKLSTWNRIICYSQFMQEHIKKIITGKKVEPLFVPIDPSLVTPAKKEKIILSVGRFFPNLHSKKQDVLVTAFKQIYAQYPTWKLVLIGSVDPGGKEYLHRVRELARGLPIDIYTNTPFDVLQKWYAKASIYWHAAGYNEDLHKYPEKAEHFGVTTVEAMAGGCVPIVFGGGGQVEIVTDNKNGYIWKTSMELVRKTTALIDNRHKYRQISKNAHKRAQEYNVEIFCSKVHELVER